MRWDTGMWTTTSFLVLLEGAGRARGVCGFFWMGLDACWASLVLVGSSQICSALSDWALMYFRFSAKAPGDITHSSLPWKNITQEGLEKPISVHKVNCHVLLSRGQHNQLNQPSWLVQFLQGEGILFPVGCSADQLRSPGPRTQCHHQEQGKKERGTLYRTPLYLYLRNNNN